MALNERGRRRNFITQYLPVVLKRKYVPSKFLAAKQFSNTKKKIAGTDV
jgi:hypothetical protein